LKIKIKQVNNIGRKLESNIIVVDCFGIVN